MQTVILIEAYDKIKPDKHMAHYLRNSFLKILGLGIFGFLFYKLDIIHRLDVTNYIQLGFFVIAIVIAYIVKQLI